MIKIIGASEMHADVQQRLEVCVCVCIHIYIYIHNIYIYITLSIEMYYPLCKKDMTALLLKSIFSDELIVKENNVFIDLTQLNF